MKIVSERMEMKEIAGKMRSAERRKAMPTAALLLFLLLWSLTGCSKAEMAQASEVTTEAVSEAAAEEKETAKYPTFTYKHYASGGTEEEYEAVILFEQSCSTFTSYQVACSGCTCRDSLVNYYSVCYVELLNTKPTAGEASIRSITFGNNQGLWGDSNPNYYHQEYTEEYMDENFVQRLVGVTKDEISEWGGYGMQLPVIDVDAVSGATVSTSNITSMLKSLFEYHAAKYYTE